MKTIEITIESGVVQDVFVPDDTQIKVYDADENTIHVHHADGSISIESAAIRAVRQSMNALRYWRKKGIVSMESDEVREVAAKMKEGTEDFEAGNFRFIHVEAVDRIMVEELEGDAYCLGCFNADFLADIVNLPLKAIETLQKAEAFEALGKIIMDGGYTAKIAEKHADADGYGYHFAHDDGYTHDCGNYYMFKNN
jgi:hypothetical protein